MRQADTDGSDSIGPDATASPTDTAEHSDAIDAIDDPLESLKGLLRRAYALSAFTMTGLERAAGVSHTTASQALNGQTVPSEATIVKLSRALKIDKLAALPADTNRLLELRKRAKRLEAADEAARTTKPSIPEPGVAGVFSWRKWVDVGWVRLFGTGPAGARYISRATDTELHEYCLSWLEDPTAPARITLIVGKHGTGRSVAIERVAAQLADEGFEDRLYVVNSPLGVAHVDLTQVGAGPRPCFFIDDADEAEALAPMLRAVIAGGVHIVATASSTVFADQVQLIVPQDSCELITLPMRPDADELQEVCSVLRPDGQITKRERRLIRQCSLRGVVGVLTDDDSQTAEVSQRLYGLWQQSRLQPWMSPLLLSTARKIPVPRSILLRSLDNTALPPEVDSWIRHADEADDHLLWVEDPHIAAYTRLRMSRDLGPAAFDDHVVDTASTLLRSIRPERALDRRFARSLFRALRVGQRRDVAQRTHEVLWEAVELDSLPNVAFSWLPLLVSAGHPPATMGPRYKELLSRPPRDAVEVALLLHHLGDQEVAVALEEMLEGAAAWPTDVWTRFLDMLRVAPGRHRRWLTRLALPLLRGDTCDIRELLRQRTALHTLGDCVEAFAEPQDRRWLWQHLREIVVHPSTSNRNRNIAARHTESLTDRCIGQDRSNLALNALGSYLRHGTQLSTEETVNNYWQLEKAENREHLAESAIHDLRLLARNLGDPGRAQDVWKSVLSLARHWQPAELPALTEEVLDFLRAVREAGGPPSAGLELALTATRCVAQSRSLTLRNATFLLGPFDRQRTTPWAGQLFLTLVAATAASPVPPATPARELLAALADQEGRALRSTAAQYAASMTDWIRLPTTCQVPTSVTALHPYAHKRVVGELLPYLRLAACPNPVERSRRLIRRFGGNRELEGMIVTEILRLGQPAIASELAFRGPRDSTSSRLLMRAAVEAMRGRIETAEHHMLTAHRRYEREGAGAHPAWVRKAACALLSSAATNKADYLRVTAQVMSRTPLPSVEAMLSRQWSVNFEPDFTEGRLDGNSGNQP